jgi:hypothetical protein
VKDVNANIADGVCFHNKSSYVYFKNRNILICRKYCSVIAPFCYGSVELCFSSLFDYESESSAEVPNHGLCFLIK